MSLSVKRPFYILYFISYKYGKKLDLYAFCLQKWLHKEEILIKLNMSFLIKYDDLLGKRNEIWKKTTIALKRNLKVKLYIMKNI